MGSLNPGSGLWSLPHAFYTQRKHGWRREGLNEAKAGSRLLAVFPGLILSSDAPGSDRVKEKGDWLRSCQGCQARGQCRQGEGGKRASREQVLSARKELSKTLTG